jgi:hypothetical protein
MFTRSSTRWEHFREFSTMQDRMNRMNRLMSLSTAHSAPPINEGITRRGLTCGKAARQYPVGVDAILRLFPLNCAYCPSNA